MLPGGTWLAAATLTNWLTDMALSMNARRYRLAETLANARQHLIPGGAFGHRPNLSAGPRHGGPPIPSGLVEQHLNVFAIDLEFGDFSHDSLSGVDLSHG